MFENLLAAGRMAGIALALALVIAACGSPTDDAAEADLTVVATTTVLGDVVSNIVDEDASVVVLIPVGTDPHDFRASSSQVASINGADLVVANGLSLEEGLEDVLDAAEGDGVTVLRIGPLVDPLPFSMADDDHGDDHPDEQLAHEERSEEHGSEDPHVWLDPLRMAEAAGLIAEQLAAVAPDVDWAARAEAYADELEALDLAIQATLSTVPAEARRLVTNHDSLGYFADRYSFEVVGTVVPSGTTLGDPSSEELAALIDVMRTEGVRAIFAETIQPTALADAVASELGESVLVVELYTGSLGESGSEAETLIGMLEANARLIADALDG